jgi:hypothetical protein
MGTRAQFFVGNPQDLEHREFLGTVAWDGRPNGDCGDAVREAKTPDQNNPRTSLHEDRAAGTIE